jgi:uncharacterized protein (DUF1778 family)
VKTHTTLDLDRELLVEAATALGTTRTTDTIHAALREVVARRARIRLMARDWSDLKDLLPEMREPRVPLPHVDEASEVIEMADQARPESLAASPGASRRRRQPA